MAFWLRMSGWSIGGKSSIARVDEVSQASMPCISTSTSDSRVWNDSQASRIALYNWDRHGMRSGCSHRRRWSRSSKSWWHSMHEDGSRELYRFTSLDVGRISLQSLTSWTWRDCIRFSAWRWGSHAMEFIVASVQLLVVWMCRRSAGSEEALRMAVR
jgi:hypothetical protein